MSLVRGLAALALFAAASPLAACGSEVPPRPACPAGQVCMEFGNTADPLTLDPQKSSGTWETDIITEMVEGLTAYSPEGRAVPAMATRWETSPDGLVWTFHLRKAQWSDGVPVTADDFVFGLQRMMTPETAAGQASQLYAIKNAQAVNAGKLPATALGVRAIDPMTVEITLAHPWPVLAEYADGPVMAPARRDLVAKWGDAWVRPEHYAANGPYRLASWTLGDKVVLVKNPLYYDAAKVCIDRVNFYPTTDSVSAERRVQRGELDVNTSIVSNRIAFLRKGPMAPYVRTHAYVGVTYLTFNLRDVAALRDRRVRQALSMAIDREFITGKLLRGGQVPAYAYVAPGMVDYHNPVRVYWADWSLDKRQAEARRLLAAAGYGPGRPLKLELKYRNGIDTSLFTVAIQADLRAVGAQISLAANETQVAYASYNVRDYQIGDAGWVGANDAMGNLYLHRSDTGAQNYANYKNPRFDGFLDAADREPDIEKRAALMAEAERVLLDDAPIAPLYFPANRNLVNPNVTGWVDNAADHHRVKYLCFKDVAARRAMGGR